MKRILLLLLPLVLWTTACTNKSISSSNEVEVAELPAEYLMFFEKQINKGNDSTLYRYQDRKLEATASIKQFYRLQIYQPIWTTNFQPNELADELIQLLSRAQNYGLDTAFYDFGKLMSLSEQLGTASGEKELFRLSTDFELLLSNSCFNYMSHLRSGVLFPDSATFGYRLKQFPDRFPELLSTFIVEDNLTAGVFNLQPSGREYTRLQQALVLFLTENKLTKQRFNIPDIKTDSVLCYENARKILIYHHYLDKSSKNTSEQKTYSLSGQQQNESNNNDILFNNTIFVQAIKQFQKDHGLHADGVIGTNTRIALAMSNYERFLHIAVSLERLRWERAWAGKHVYVNIPSYQMKVVENEKVQRIFKVVVGSRAHRTPLFNSKIEYFITYPEWNVPNSISSKEILPKLRKDSTYLKRNNYTIYTKDRKVLDASQVDWSKVKQSEFDFYVKQGSGRSNSLGTIKFIFPNKYSVYLHDTPSKRHFANEVRAYSHGCMRLHNPVDFGEFLAEMDGCIDVDTFKSVMANRTKKQINLNTPLPIYIRYVTCEADENKQITFFQDVYGLDRKIYSQMFAKE